jgi:hypothetical protein
MENKGKTLIVGLRSGLSQVVIYQRKCGYRHRHTASCMPQRGREANSHSTLHYLHGDHNQTKEVISMSTNCKYADLLVFSLSSIS